MRIALLPFLPLLLPSMPLLRAQEGVPQPPGLVPEQMWYAPTAEDWAKPVQIQWQRTWDDAVRLSQQTKKPILVCVNMDGEIASEHYAGVRYRDPELGKLFEPYVCVIASVYRHNPRDYDDQGRRIPCPRLGCVTCGEHIAMEPIVYEKFLDGKRISPRHIMVELDGSEVYDVFYTWDIDSVFQQIQDGIANRKIQAPPIVKGDRSLQERIASPDSADREQVEREFALADAMQKRRMLELAMKNEEKVPLELLRQAAHAVDPELAQQARAGMLKTDDPLAVELIADTLREPLDSQERGQLVDKLAQFGDRSTHARTLATAHKGLADAASTIDGKRWQSVLVGPAYSSAIGADADVVAKAQRRDDALQEAPDDPQARLDVAESSLLQALELTPGVGRGAARLYEQQRELLLADARRHVDKAVALGATGWRVPALRAVAFDQLGQRQRAQAAALEAMPTMPPDAPGRLAMEVLFLFASARQDAIVDAVRNKREWPGEWTKDVHTAYSLLLRHPLGTDFHVGKHYDFLDYFRSPDTDEVLRQGLERFPTSAPLHERLRRSLLRTAGPDGLERHYEQLLAAEDAPAVLPWFAGYASLVAAEQHRRRMRPDEATAAYHRAIGHFDAYRERTGSDDGAHYVAMAHGGLARLALQKGDLDLTFSELQQTFRIAPGAVAATDGLGITAMQTAEMLRGRALSSENADLVRRLDEALKALPDEAYVLPEYEQRSRGQRSSRRPR